MVLKQYQVLASLEETINNSDYWRELNSEDFVEDEIEEENKDASIQKESDNCEEKDINPNKLEENDKELANQFENKEVSPSEPKGILTFLNFIEISLCFFLDSHFALF